MEEMKNERHTDSQTDAGAFVQEGIGEIVAIALRAAYWFLFCGAFLCAVFTAFFPFASMQLYAKLGMQGLAQEKAQRVILRQVERNLVDGKTTYAFRGERPQADSQFADALYYYAIPYASSSLESSIQKNGAFHANSLRAAKTVVQNGDIYTMFGSDRADVAWQNDAIAYATQNGATSAHPDLYSYKTIVRKSYMRAKYIAYPSEIPSELVRLYYIVTDPDNLSANTMDEYSVWFAELNAVINTELDIVGYKGIGAGSNMNQILADNVRPGNHFRYLYAKTSFTENGVQYAWGKQDSLKVIEQRVQAIKDYIYSYDTKGETSEYLRRAYWARQLTLLTQNIRVVTDIFYCDRGGAGEAVELDIAQMQANWRDQYDRYTFGSSVGHGYDWYNYVLDEYTTRLS